LHNPSSPPSIAECGAEGAGNDTPKSIRKVPKLLPNMTFQKSPGFSRSLSSVLLAFLFFGFIN